MYKLLDAGDDIQLMRRLYIAQREVSIACWSRGISGLVTCTCYDAVPLYAPCCK